jgi:hypothetical protein
MNLDRLYSKLEEKMSNQLGYRGDLYTTDSKPINKNTAKILIGFNTTLGHPTLADLSKYIVKIFEGRISPKLETARVYPDAGGVSLIIGKVRPTRAYSDRKQMVAVASTLFLDEKIGDKWEVEKNGDKVFLARVDDEDISEIISQRMKRMQIKANVLTFASIQEERCFASVQPGDTVKFFKDNEVQEGVVLSVGSAKITLKRNDKNVVVDPPAIFEVVKVNSTLDQSKIRLLRDYFEKAYPAGYGKMYIDLVEKTGR